MAGKSGRSLSRFFVMLAVLTMAVMMVASACGSREKVIVGSDGRTGYAGVAGDGGSEGTQETPTETKTKSTSKSGGKSDVGVTDDSILLGSVASLSGAMPEQFEGTPAASYSYLRALNEKGGWRGRKFKMTVLDDALDGTQNLAQTKKLVEENKVFALLANATPVQSSSTKYLSEQGVPVIGTLPDTSGCRDANVVPCMLSDHKWASGAEKYLGPQGKKIGSKAAIIWIAQQISRDQAQGAKAALDKYGWDVVYEFEASLTQIDFTSFALEARKRGADFVYSVMEIASNTRLAKAMNRQEYKAPLFGLVNYDEVFIAVGGAASEGHYGTWLSEHLVSSDAKPMADFRSTFARYYPKIARKIGPFSFAGWIFTRMFVEQGLERLDADITRKELLDAMYKTRDWTGDGITLPWNIQLKSTPGGQTPPTCTSIVKVVNQKFVLETPNACAEPTDF